jgi:hypothetical protein
MIVSPDQLAATESRHGAPRAVAGRREVVGVSDWCGASQVPEPGESARASSHRRSPAACCEPNTRLSLGVLADGLGTPASGRSRAGIPSCFGHRPDRAIEDSDPERRPSAAVCAPSSPGRVRHAGQTCRLGVGWGYSSSPCWAYVARPSDPDASPAACPASAGAADHLHQISPDPHGSGLLIRTEGDAPDLPRSGAVLE